MGEVVSFEDIYCEKVANRVWDMATALEEDGVELLFMPYQIDGLLHQFYQLYQEKNIVYSFSEDMECYFSTIFDDVYIFGFPSLSFSIIINGFYNCYEMMNPVEIGRRDFDRVIKNVEEISFKEGDMKRAR